MHSYTRLVHPEPTIPADPFHGPEPLRRSVPPAGRPKGPRVIGGLAVRLIVVVALMATTAAVGTFAMAAPAAAHGVDSNGCTGVPDSGYGFNFHDACDRHDRCYSIKPYGTSSAGRSACDRVFLGEMLSYCSRYSSWSGRGIACRVVARTYYVGVRVVGYPFWALSSPAPIA